MTDEERAVIPKLDDTAPSTRLVRVVCSDCDGMGSVALHSGSDNMDIMEVKCTGCRGRGYLNAVVFSGIKPEGYDMAGNEAFTT